MREDDALQARDRVLRARAQALAGVRGDAPMDRVDLLVFELAQERYALALDHVREVCPLAALVPVPCTPRFVLGIINLRGEICPVIDLRRLFNLPERGLSNATRAVVLRHGEREFGLLADVVVGVLALARNSIHAAPPTLTGIQAEFLQGVAEDGLIVLDAPRILAHPSMVVREHVPSLV